MHEPDVSKLYDIIRMAASWLKTADDLTYIVYDLGTSLAKQNVRYAEVCVDPLLFPDLNLSYDGVLTAINDGRDRAKRAWGVDMAWIFTIPREEPRRADDLARWVSTANAQRGDVVALGLSGDEKTQPVGQFTRAFQMVEKKEFGRVVRAGDAQGAEGVRKTLEELHPHRILDARNVIEVPELVQALLDQNVTLAINLTRAQKQNWVASIAEYPLRALYDAGLSLVLGSDMPAIYRTTLTAEYSAAVEQGGLSLDELENLALNAVRSSFLPEAAKAELLQSFTDSYAALRTEHLETA
jgi:adenosine deaminase